MSKARATDLFVELLGSAFDELPVPIRALHTAPLPRRFEGRATVQAADSVLGSLIARVLSFPRKTHEAPIAVTIEPSGRGQIWIRHFTARPMRSRLWPEDGLLCEQFGPVRLRFRLEGNSEGLAWRLVSVHLGGSPLPQSWFRQIEARESVRDGRYHFFVRGALPWIGHIIGYEGWLHVD